MNSFSRLSPYIMVSDLDNAVSFYQKAFGFNIKDISKEHGKEDGPSVHAEMTFKEDLMIMFGKEGAYEGKAMSPNTSGVQSPIGLYIYCDDVDQIYQQAMKAGAESITEPEDMFWGDRMCRVQDPEGYIWAFAAKKN